MANNNSKPLTRISTAAIGLAVLAIFAVGLYATWLRFSRGLGATTHLSDSVPWGLWIWFTLTRVGLSAGGFILAAVVYLFHYERFHSIVRAAVLTAFVGYSLVAVELIYDLGLPLHFWHPLIYWNIHSAMLETAWCIGTYVAVLGMEMAIPFTEGVGWKKIADRLKGLVVLLALLGAVLSTLHQSSIGTIFLIASEKMSPIWYSSWMPLIFLASALPGGLGFLVMELFMAEKFVHWRFSPELVKALAKLLLGTLAAYLIILCADFTRLGKWTLLANDPQAAFWLGLETIPGVILPIVLLAIPAVRNSRIGFRIAAVLAVLGLFMNRLNFTIVGFLLQSHARYFPTWQEISITFMILTLGVIIFIVAAKILPIFPAEHEHEA